MAALVRARSGQDALSDQPCAPGGACASNESHANGIAYLTPCSTTNDLGTRWPPSAKLPAMHIRIAGFFVRERGVNIFHVLTTRVPALFTHRSAR